MNPNVKIYGRLGFRMIQEMECEEGWDVCKVSLQIWPGVGKIMELD